MMNEVLSFDLGTTVVGVLDVNADIYTAYEGPSQMLAGARRIVSCPGTIISFNGNLFDLPKIAEMLGVAPSGLELQGTHDDMSDITCDILWPGTSRILGSKLDDRFALVFGKDFMLPPPPSSDSYLAHNWEDCYKPAQLWKKWKLGELRRVG